MNWLRSWLCADLIASLDAAEDALRAETREHIVTISQRTDAEHDRDSERTRRISAETMASERHEEIIRLIDQNKELRDDLSRAYAERIRSVDAVNLKLMETKVPEPPPDFKEMRQRVASTAIENIRAMHKRVDMAILTGMHEGFKPRIVVNETPVPAPESETAA